MAIDYGSLRNISSRKIISALDKDGFVPDRQVGSHKLYKHPDGRRVTVTFHSSGQTFRPKTLKSMIEDEARWTEADLKRLGLLK